MPGVMSMLAPSSLVWTSKQVVDVQLVTLKLQG